MSAEFATAPGNVVNRLLAGPFGAFLLKPWYDPVALHGIVRYFMPASRAWAAASAAVGDVPAFLQALGAPRTVGAGLVRALAETAHRRRTYDEAEAAWERAALGGASGAELAALEDRRLACADAWMRARAAFLPAHLLTPFPAVKFAIADEAELVRRHGARLADPARAFPDAADAAGFAASAQAVVHGRRLGWVRFPAAATELEPWTGRAPGWARIEQPRDGAAKGAVVFCHGIMMEREHWASLYDQAEVFLEPEGGALAVISPEGPGHGRRMIAGYYGGEPILAHGVGGIVDYFAAHVVEVGRLIAWARRTYGGPVAVAGVSLGALTAQLVVSAAAHWPAAARPDAALLLTTNDSLVDVTFSGSLAGGLGFPAALARAGWTSERIDRWRPLVDPGRPALPPERIVVVLGTTDTVTPYAGGARLAQRWGVPDANVFRWHGGHFAAAFSVLRDRAPIRRFKQALAEVSP